MVKHARSAAATDRHYLKLLRKGLGAREIARREGVCFRTVYYAIERARLAERPPQPVEMRGPKLVPAFGSSVKALATLTCEDVHRGPIPKGSRCVCMVCHRSGCDHIYGPPRPSVKRPMAKLATKPKAAAKPKKPKGARKAAAQ